MSAVKPSPGPWVTEHDQCDGCVRIYAANAELIAIVQGQNFETDEANAGAIAAVHALASSLREMIAAREARLRNQVIPGRHELAIVRDARAALAKAGL